MKILSTTLIPLALTAFAVPAFAQGAAEQNSDAILFGDHFQVEGQMRGVVGWNENADGDYKDYLNTNKTNLKMTGKITEDIRAVVTLELNKQLRENGEDVSDSFDSDEFMKEAYIEVRNIAGRPIAFVIGKAPIAFGAENKHMPIYENNPLYGRSFQERVIGFTVRLDYPLTSFIDSIEASIYSSEQDAELFDGEIGDIDSGSIRVSGRILDNLKYRASYAHQGNNHLAGDDNEENKGALGLVLQTESGWEAWVDALVTDKTTNGDDVSFGVTGGVSKEVGPGDVIVEATWVQDDQIQLGLGYNIHVTKNVSVGPEVRYTMYDADDKDDAFSFGIAGTVKFGGEEASPKQVLFGAK